MLKILLELLFCLMYVLGVYICVYPYLTKKRSRIYQCLFLVLYAFVDFVITGDYFLKLDTYLLSNIFVMISDYMMICLYEGKFKFYLLFYTSSYFCIYSILVNMMTYLLIQVGISVEMIYQSILLRTLLVIAYDGLSCLLYMLLRKLHFFPTLSIIKENHYIYNGINTVVLIAYLIFFGFSLIRIENNLIIFIFIIFILLWLSLLNLLNKSISLSVENNRLMMMNMSYKNIETVIDNYKKESHMMNKMKHDIRNNLLIIREMKNQKDMQDYIDSMIQDIKTIDSVFYHTGSQTVDILFSLKEHQYPQVNFTYEFDHLDVHIDNKDLSSLLFNLIDNAAQNASLKNPKVKVTIQQYQSLLTVTVTNNIDSIPIFITRKGKNHGYGLKIIKEIVEKYHGSFDMEVIDDHVVIQVIIENRIEK